MLAVVSYRGRGAELRLHDIVNGSQYGILTLVSERPLAIPTQYGRHGGHAVDLCRDARKWHLLRRSCTELVLAQLLLAWNSQ